jgi:succinoglycan biosynthesis protein ExoM
VNGVLRVVQQAPTRPRSVVIAVLTYRRPDDLTELLPLLVQQAAGEVGQDTSVLVVDNDPEAGARETCTGVHPAVRYVHEPRPGIAAARSRALREAHAHDLLVFIDDDERPSAGWLHSLLDTYDRTGSAAVVGPVISSFDGPLDPWISAGGFFERRRLPTGSPLTVAATNNLLLDMRVVRDRELDFDDRFGLSGGSDTLFTRQLVDSGARMVWCDEAVVTDVVPAARATRDWVLRRRLRFGNTTSRVELELAGSAAARLRVRAGLLVRGVARVGGGALRFGLGTIGRHVGHRANGARTVARGIGMLSGAVGHTYVEYKRP